ncbi:hypothetical protein E3O19_00750 [Cryobacterium algoritolerans]|uniref:Uncharacterized protein n=1 Tax=Cryobacterium algoritolerans TaxID=1259184 RepID=A0A4R8WXE0_9MICO|nr:hypothetical protein [Cryobacterium algoritolerans]TFC21000.1 hypothetical protein E3O19_00750 [Cryobacterium algoritolerans]
MVDDQLTANRSRLDGAEEALRELCEQVSPPKRTLDYRNYFCARNLDNTDDVARNTPRRAAFYEAVVEYGRAYAQIATELAAAGYSPREAVGIEKEVAYFQELQGELRRVSGDRVAEDSARQTM